MPTETHVVVIGGGPAGSAAGIALAQRGVRVTICEARAFPRVKVCGEFLSPSAAPALEALVGAAALRKAGARLVREVVVEVGEREARWRLREPGLALSRARLDALLLERARSEGAAIRQPALVRSVAHSDAGVVAWLASGERIAADAVVHADGSGGLDPAGAIRRRRDALGFKRHFTTRDGAAIEGVRMRACRGAYVGLAQVEGRLATCALIARRDMVAAHRGDASAVLRAILPAENASAVLDSPPGDDPLIEGRKGDVRWLACGGPDAALVAGGHSRSFRIGDAAAGIEPIGGEGIAFALRSGLALAQRFEPNDLSRTGRRLDSDLRRMLSVRRVAARAAGALFVREGLTRALWPALHAPSATIGLWCAATGK